MSLISLRDSLTRSKARWKKRFHVDSKDTSPTLAKTACSPPSTGAHPDSPPRRESTDIGPAILAPVQTIGNPQELVGNNNQPRENKPAWSVIKSLLESLESSTEVFGPLKSAISGLNQTIGIFESDSQGRKEYEELRIELEGVLTDLVEHVRSPTGLAMTDSVKRLCADIEGELQNVDKAQARNTGRRLADALEMSDELLKCYRRIRSRIERLTLNASMGILATVNKHTTETKLAGMLPAKSATYNSAESDDLRRGGCVPGTRRAQVNLLLEWAHNPDTGRTCWMNGMAGTGKTTIAYSVCNELEKTYELGASFFCSRSIPECRQIKYIIPSIAYQLARFSFPFLCALVKILESDPDVHARALKIQCEKLIVEPLMEVQGSLPTDFIIVIDALDECENENGAGQILDLLLSQLSSLPIRFLLSSRPEPEITRRMTSLTSKQGDMLLVLHDLDSDSVKADIETYMRHELEHISLTDAQWARLIEQCGVLFIYASTTCHYIKQGYDMEALDEAIDTILGSNSVIMGHGDENVIDGLYSTILTVAFDVSRTNKANRIRMKDVLETVICAQEPMSLDTLAGLLGLSSAKQVDALLKPLRSVLNVAEDTGLVTTLHASFPDFMFSSSRSGAFHCNQAARNLLLAEACLLMIDSVEPKFNICALPSSYLLDSEVEGLDDRVRHSISPKLVYVCLYWSIHLYLSEFHGKLVDIVRGFYSQRLLIWMEILNLTKNMQYGTNTLRRAESWCDERAVPGDVTRIAHDAREFVSTYANHPIVQSTPHIYVSMLLFWPRYRPISAVYFSRTHGLVEPEGTAMKQRSALLATWSVSAYPILSMSLSGDGSQILAAGGPVPFVVDASTGDRLLDLDAAHMKWALLVIISPTGDWVAFRNGGGIYLTMKNDPTGRVTELLTEGVSRISPIAFSHDGTRVALGSSSSAYIYGVQHGELILGPLEGHTKDIYKLAFSPNGLNLATGSVDNTIRIWDTQSGQLVGNPLEGHNNEVRSVSYSPDGARLVSGSADHTIRVWDPQTAQTTLGPLKQHSSRVNSVAFSPNGAFIASGSDDQTIRVYDAETGQTVLGPLAAHTDWVTCVIFSPDSAQLFSSSHDGTIHVWSVQGLDISSSSQKYLPVDLRYARYSPDGLRAVSGSSNGMIYVWDIKTRHTVLGPLEGHAHDVTAVEYSPDGAYIVSSSLDRTLRIWDAQNGKYLHGPIRGYTSDVTCIRFSPDSSIIASGFEDGTVRIWDIRNGQQVIKPLQSHTSEVYSVAVSPDGSQIVSGSSNRTLRVWDQQTGETVVGPLQCREDEYIQSVEFSPDGTRVLSGSRGGHLRIWELSTNLTYLIYEQNHISSVAFSPDSRLAACGSYFDYTIRVWDIQSRKLILGPLLGHVDDVLSVQFSPDGSHVMSSSRDGTIRFWDIPSRGSDSRYSREKGDDSSLTIDDPSDPWSLDESGWVVNQQKQKLLWIPGDLRICLLRHQNDSIICHRGSLRLKFDGANIGELWTSCYIP